MDGRLHVATSSTLVTLDWQGSTDSSLRSVGWHIYEGLVCYDESFKIIPQLARKWEVNADNTEYTFYLRQGVQFQKGYGEMTATDVKASLDRFFSKGVRAQDFSNVKGIEIINTYTVKITLTEPSGVFLCPSKVITGNEKGQIGPN